MMVNFRRIPHVVGNTFLITNLMTVLVISTISVRATTTPATTSPANTNKFTGTTAATATINTATTTISSSGDATSNGNVIVAPVFEENTWDIVDNLVESENNQLLDAVFHKRMGVIGPPSTSRTPRFVKDVIMDGSTMESDLLSSSSQIREKRVNADIALPLSPHSPHNVFSVHAGTGGVSLQRAQERLSINDIELPPLSVKDDLELKLKSLTKATEVPDRPVHHVLDDGSIQCDKFITGEEFYVTSPNYPYNYPPNITCEWQVYRRDSGVCGVELTVLRFDLAPPDPVTGQCRDAFTVQGRKMCGRRQRGDTALVLFPGLLVSLKLESGPGYGASGLLVRGRQVTSCRQPRSLSMTIDVNPQCVKSLRGNRFHLRSPGYPGPYPHNSECWYHVHKRNENMCGVELVIDSFSLEAASCMFDYLETAKKRICGRKEAGTKYYFPFDGEKLSIRFRTDESITRPGFRIAGKQVSCDDINTLEQTYEDPKTLQDFLSSTAGRKDYIVSGSIPKPSISATAPDDDINYILALVGLSPLPLEGEKKSRQHLGRQIGDGVDDVKAMYDLNDIELVPVTEADFIDLDTSTDVNPAGIELIPIGVPLNETDPIAITTLYPSTNTNSSTNQLDIVTTNPVGIPLPTLTLVEEDSNSLSDNLGPCDQIYSGDSFTLRSPKVTDGTQKSIDCSFFIRRSSLDICEIRVVLLTVNLAPPGEGGKCGDQHLQVAATRFCGGDEDKRVRIRYPGGLVRIQLRAGAPTPDTGFTARIQQLRGTDCDSDDPAIVTSVMECDVTISRDLTTLLSPHYPNSYPNNVNCRITIRKAAQDIQSITLFLEEFDLEESRECGSDYFGVGSARICGQRRGQRVSHMFPANELEMVFHTNGRTAGRGYRIHVKQNRFPASQHFTHKPPLIVTPALQHYTQRPPIVGFGYNPNPPSNAIALIFPSSTFKPLKPTNHHQFPTPAAGFGATVFPGSGSVVTPNPGIDEAATPHATLMECGVTSRSRVITLKSPNYPDSPPANLHCIYNIEKNSNDVCQLKIEIEDLQIGSRVECGKSFLQVGSQQRLCGASRSQEIRTYHFTDRVMQLIYHTDPRGQDGGFNIKVVQMPCGNFEPIGTFGEVQTLSGGQILNSGNHNSGGGTSIEIIETTSSDKISGSIDSSHHFNGHDYDIYPTHQHQHKPKPLPGTDTDHHTDLHYVYYYVPQKQGGPDYEVEDKNPGKGFDLLRMIKGKFDKMKNLFNKDKNKDQVSVEIESEHRRQRWPSQTPRPVRFSSSRPQRYNFVANPYYRPDDSKKSRPTVRFRYPQVFPSTESPVRLVNYRYGNAYNAYIVLPTARPQVPITPRPTQSAVLYSVVPPKPVIVTPRPIFLSSPRPVIVSQPRPILYSNPSTVTTPRPTIRVTPRPLGFLTVSPAPVSAITSARLPLTASTIYLAPSHQPPTPVRLVSVGNTGHRRPVLGYNAYLITPDRPVALGQGRSQQTEDVGLKLISAASMTSSVTIDKCDDTIRDEEFYIKSPNYLNNSPDERFSCAYTIAKSDGDKCSLVLEVQDFQQSFNCLDCPSPAVHLLTSFSPLGELMLHFNDSVTGRHGTSFTLHGRQVPCEDQQTSASAPVVAVAPQSVPHAGSAGLGGGSTGVIGGSTGVIGSSGIIIDSAGISPGFSSGSPGFSGGSFGVVGGSFTTSPAGGHNLQPTVVVTPKPGGPEWWGGRPAVLVGPGGRGRKAKGVIRNGLKGVRGMKRAMRGYRK